MDPTKLTNVLREEPTLGGESPAIITHTLQKWEAVSGLMKLAVERPNLVTATRESSHSQSVRVVADAPHFSVLLCAPRKMFMIRTGRAAYMCALTRQRELPIAGKAPNTLRT
jgi:hypothetical protein